MSASQQPPGNLNSHQWQADLVEVPGVQPESGRHDERNSGSRTGRKQNDESRCGFDKDHHPAEPDRNDVDGCVRERHVKVRQEGIGVPGEVEILEDRPRPVSASPFSGCATQEEESDEELGQKGSDRGGPIRAGRRTPRHPHHEHTGPEDDHPGGEKVGGLVHEQHRRAERL